MPKQELEWRTEKRRIGDLLPFEYNPRQMSDDQKGRLHNSLTRFNVVELPAVDADGTIVAGHQRIDALIEMGRGDEEIEVRVPNRKLTKKEFTDYNIISNKVTGAFDFDILRNNIDVFGLDSLHDLGFTDLELGIGSSFDPTDPDNAARLDEKTKVTCPECGHEFIP